MRNPSALVCARLASNLQLVPAPVVQRSIGHLRKTRTPWPSTIAPVPCAICSSSILVLTPLERPPPGSKTRLEPTPEPSGICITDPPFSRRQSTTLCGAGSPASPEQRHTESRVPLITDRPAPNCLQLGPLDGKKPLAPHDCSCFSSSSAQRTERPSRLHFHNILIFQQPRESIPVQGRRKHGGHHG